MFRFVVATILMLTQLAGPLACCCASGRLTAILSPSPSAVRNKAEAAPSCCKHHAPPGDDRRAPADQPPHERPSCPCAGHWSQAAVVPADSEARQQHLDPFSSAQPAATAERLSFLPELRSPVEQVPLPFVTADDLLRSLHILRC